MDEDDGDQTEAIFKTIVVGTFAVGALALATASILLVTKLILQSF